MFTEMVHNRHQNRIERFMRTYNNRKSRRRRGHIDRLKSPTLLRLQINSNKERISGDGDDPKIKPTRERLELNGSTLKEEPEAEA